MYSYSLQIPGKQPGAKKAVPNGGLQKDTHYRYVISKMGKLNAF
jgi:hypothetical protein